jgi:hypothetical protein
MSAVNVSIARYALAIASVAVIVGSTGLAAVALRRRFLAAQDGAPARLSEAVIGVALLVAMLEALGALGLFRLVPIVVAFAVVGAIGAAAIRRTVPARKTRPPISWPAVAVAGLVTAAVAAEWTVPTLTAYDYGIRTFDSLWYHLPWAASFAQTGHITPLRPDLEFLLAFYPATSELFHALGITLLGRDTLSPGINFIWLGLALLAAWCIGRPRGRGGTSVTGASIVLAAPMMYFSQPGSADGDVLGLFLLLGAVALVLGNSQDRAAPLVLAAIAAGLAVEVKLTFLAPIAALTIGVPAVAPRGRRAATAGMWLGPLIVAGGFWYARDLVAIGNPLPWSSFGHVLPTPAPPLQQHTTFAVAHYLTDQSFWGHFFVSGMASQLGRWWWVIASGSVIGALLCLLPGAGRKLRIAALVALAGLVAYIVTPNSAMGPDGDPVGFGFNLRYAAPPMALALALAPLAPPLQTPRRQAALTIAFAATLVATIAEPALWPGRHTGGAIAFALVTLLACLAVGAVRGGAVWPAYRTAGLITVATALTVLALGGYPWQRHYLNVRYTFKPSVSHLSGVWAFFRKVHHARVGLVGTYGEFFSYPLTGVDDSNRVVYVAAHGDHGSFTPIETCRAFRTAVNAGHFDYLVATPERDFWRPSRLRPAPEAGWTRTDPGARLLFTRQAGGQTISVFELRHRSSAAGCA